MRRTPSLITPVASSTGANAAGHRRGCGQPARPPHLLVAACAMLAGVGPVQATAQVPDQGSRQFLLDVPSLIAALAATGPETITYAYDAKGRLVRVVRDGAVADVTTAYQHDRADNRTRLTTTGSPNPPQP